MPGVDLDLPAEALVLEDCVLEMNDREWQLLEPLLPPPKPGGRPVKYPRREVVNAIRYVLRTGCSWGMLPHDLPPWRR